MKCILFATSALLVLATISSTASAADMPPAYKAPPATVAAPVFDWSGLYAGLHAGAGWKETSWVVEGIGDTGPFRGNGALAGGTIGINWQRGPWVFGLEADISWSNIDASTTIFPPFGSCAGVGVPCTSELEWLATARARAGYASNEWLIYLTGGAAFGRLHLFASGVTSFNVKRTETGWTVGGGAEFAFARNWTAKAEYLFVDLSDFGFISPGPVTGDRYLLHILRIGANYKF